ncbi:uncharacterized protein LOC111389116 [Olea europaea var. sylvestris]|uniref:uncharacterized protein LOC111389116 n=1 Tax=Olea europaea var. sylvestris TaxID=158386 RepID=UPI000C1D7186|nr:uncharacterized protein LOC111389116 [Olea europaea var. sylvestris]
MIYQYSTKERLNHLMKPGTDLKTCSRNALSMGSIKRSRFDSSTHDYFHTIRAWKLGLGEAEATTVTLQLADRSPTHPRGIIEDVLIKVEKFIFPADFLILDMEEDKDVPLILGRPFLATRRALIDVQRGQSILRLGEEQLSFNVFKAMKLPTESDSCYQVDIIDKAVQETFLLHGPSDAYETNPPYTRKRHFEELGMGNTKPLPSVQQPPVLELKQLPPHLRYAYLGELDTLPVIISNTVSEMEEEKLLRVLRENKTAIGWTIADIKGISPSLCMHKILMEENCKPSIESQRRLNPNMKEVVRAEILKLLDAGIINPISDSAWISPVQVLHERNTSHSHSLIRFKGGRSFLRHAGFYRRFIKDFSKITKPLCNLLMKDATFEFNEGCLTTFNTLKEKLTTAPVIVAPDWELPFELMCDASDHAVDALLGQRRNKIFYVIYYASRTLNDAQINYATTEKELLAVVFTFDKFRSYLVGSKIIVYTDHAALKYLLTKKDGEPRLIRWVLLLQEFDIEIRDKKGTENVVTDHLSKLEPGETEDLVDINEIFPDEQMLRVDEAPWYADIVNYFASSIPQPDYSSHQRKKNSPS